MINAALVGFGRIGKLHYHNLKNSKIFDIKFIIDIIQPNVTDIDVEIDIPFYHPMELELKIKEFGIKSIFVCSSTEYHYSIIKTSLENNLDVFVEKPVCLKIEEMKELYELADNKNKILFAAFNRRYDPKIIKLYQEYRSGKLGQVNNILVISRDYPYPESKFIKTSGGLYQDCLIHDLDSICWILGEKPISVNTTGSMGKDNENLDSAITILKFASGTLATFISSRISNSYDQRIEFMGSKKSLVVSNSVQDKISFPERYAESYKNEMISFYLCILKNEIPKVNFQDNYLVQTLINNCNQSYQENRTIDVNIEDTHRNYDNVLPQVIECYHQQRIFQNVKFYDYAVEKYCQFNKKNSFWELFDYLSDFVDLSDPDTNLSNHQHMYQTAEAIRRDGLPEWFQLVGLIHDLGKIIYKKGNDAEGTSMNKQWAIVGDTFILGCKIPDEIVFPEFNSENDSAYQTKLGIYSQNCGLDKVKCSFGHDEYLYRMLKFNYVNLPEEAYYIIRYHSLYLWHTYQQYSWFENEKDAEMKFWVRLFQKYDLYTKNPIKVNEEEAKIYYDKLVKKFLPKSLYW